MQEQPLARVTKPPAPQSLRPETSADVSKQNLNNYQMDISLQQADDQNKSTDMESFQVPLSNRKNKPLGRPMVLSADRENITLTEALDYASGIESFYNSDLGGNPFGLYDFDSIYSHVESMNSDHLDATPYNDVLIFSSDRVVSLMTLPAEVNELSHSKSDATLPWGEREATAPQSTMWSRWSIPFHSVSLVSTGAGIEMYEPSRQTTDSTSISSEIILHNYRTDFHLMGTHSWLTPVVSSVEVPHKSSESTLTPTPVLSLMPTNQKPTNKTVELLTFKSSTQSNGPFSMTKQVDLSLPGLIITEKKIQPLTDTFHENMPLSLSQNREPLEASLTHSVYLQHDLTTDDIVSSQLYLEHLTAIATDLIPDSPETPGTRFYSNNVSDSVLPSLRSHFTSIVSNYLENTQSLKDTNIPFGELSSNWAMRTGLIMPDSTWTSQIEPLTSDLLQMYSFTETLMVGSKGHNHYSSSNNVTVMKSIRMSSFLNTVSLSGKMMLGILPSISLSSQSSETGLTQSQLSHIRLNPTQPQHGHLRPSDPRDISMDLPIETLSADADLSHLQMSPSYLIEHSTVLSQGKWFEGGFSKLHLPFSINPLLVHSASMNPSTKSIAMDAAQPTTTHNKGLHSSESSLNGDVTHLSSCSRDELSSHKDPPSGMINTVIEHANSAASVSTLHTEITVASQQGHIPPGSQSELTRFPLLNVQAPSIAKTNTYPSHTKPTASMNFGLSTNQSRGTQYSEDGHEAPTGHPFPADESASQTGHGNNVAVTQVSTTLSPLVSSGTKRPVSTLPNRVTAVGTTVPASTTPWSFPDLTELAPCPCKAHSHIICLCGLAAGNSMFSSHYNYIWACSHSNGIIVFPNG